MLIHSPDTLAHIYGTVCVCGGGGGGGGGGLVNLPLRQLLRNQWSLRERGTQALAIGSFH